MRIKNGFLNFTVFSLFFFGLQLPVMAIDFETAFHKAKNNDPKFQAAMHDKDATSGQSLRDITSYAPTFTYNQSQLPTLSVTSRTQTVSQPLFDAVKGASFLQAEPRKKIADANYLVQTHDLALRVFNAMSQIIQTNEAIKANESRLAALESQFQSAKRKYELGQGTITDQLDVQVKYEQAKADDFTLKANLKSARDQFKAIVGEAPNPLDFNLPNKHESFNIRLRDEVLARVEKNNPAILVAQANEKVAKLDVVKASGAVLPTIAYTYQKTVYTNVNAENNGLSITIPLDMGSYIGTYVAHAKSKQSSSTRLETEVKTKVEAERFYQQIEAGQQSLKIKGNAMDIARQSVLANQKSYDAGVKNTTDVLIAIQTLFQARNEYAVSAIQLGGNLLNLLLIGAEDPDEAVIRTQAFLFRK